MTRAPVGERAAYLSPVAACLRGGGAWLPGDGVSDDVLRYAPNNPTHAPNNPTHAPSS